MATTRLLPRKGRTMRRLALALLLASSCTTMSPVGSAITLEKDTGTQCVTLCGELEMVMSAVVIISSRTGCVCEPRPAKSPQAGGAGAASSGVVAAIIEEEMQQQQSAQQHHWAAHGQVADVGGATLADRYATRASSAQRARALLRQAEFAIGRSHRSGCWLKPAELPTAPRRARPRAGGVRVKPSLINGLAAPAGGPLPFARRRRERSPRARATRAAPLRVHPNLWS